MGDFGRGFVASCLGAGACCLAACLASYAFEHGQARSWISQSEWQMTLFMSGIVMLLAVPATIVGWLCIRQLPRRFVNLASTLLLGAGLGPVTIVGMAVCGGQAATLRNADLPLMLFAGVCGACGAGAAWWAGFRREARDR